MRSSQNVSGFNRSQAARGDALINLKVQNVVLLTATAFFIINLLEIQTQIIYHFAQPIVGIVEPLPTGSGKRILSQNILVVI